MGYVRNDPEFRNALGTTRVPTAAVTERRRICPQFRRQFPPWRALCLPAWGFLQAPRLTRTLMTSIPSPHTPRAR